MVPNILRLPEHHFKWKLLCNDPYSCTINIYVEKMRMLTKSPLHLNFAHNYVPLFIYNSWQFTTAPKLLFSCLVKYVDRMCLIQNASFGSLYPWMCCIKIRPHYFSRIVCYNNIFFSKIVWKLNFIILFLKSSHPLTVTKKVHCI